MGELVRLLIEVLQYLWPFRVVREYERAVCYVFGRSARLWWRWGPVVGPGTYLIVPYFMEVNEAPVVPDVVTLPAQTIDLLAGGSLTFAATVTLEVVDLDQAYNRVVAWRSAAAELTGAILAERLAVEPAERLDPSQRGRLVGGYLVALNNQLMPIGLKATALRFNNFVRGMRVYRLIQESHFPGGEA